MLCSPFKKKKKERAADWSRKSDTGTGQRIQMRNDVMAVYYAVLFPIRALTSCLTVCSQPYFRSSRASVWGCDEGEDSGPLPSTPPPSSCPHRAWLTLTCAPSRGPEMNTTPWREREREREKGREASITRAYTVPPKLTLKTPPCPGSAFTVLQSVVLTAFLWTV